MKIKTTNITEDFVSFMSGGDKMNIVIFILLLIFTGLAIYLFTISNRVKKIENRYSNKAS